MSVSMPAIEKPVALPPLPMYRFNVEQYHRMAREGIISPEEPVELLEGLIVLKGDARLVPAVKVQPRSNGQTIFSGPLPLYRFQIWQYRELVARGILPGDARVELLEGWIVLKMPRNPPHDSAIYRAQQMMFRTLPEAWICRGQSGLLTDTSQPEPDLAIVRGPATRYDQQHPTAQDTALVVEVSDAMLLSDRALKGSLYARIGIPVYWIVNLPERQVEVYTDPTGPVPEPGFRQRQDYQATETVPLVLAGQEIAQVRVQDLLP